MNILWNWLPRVGLGPFKLGENIQKFKHNYDFVLLDEEDTTNWDSYKLSELDIYIDVEDDIIKSIHSDKYFCYKGINLIGLTLEEFNQQLSQFSAEIGEYVEFDNGDIQTPYDYDEVGLQVWLSNNKVVSVICMDI
jgi:hypothetical protein